MKLDIGMRIRASDGPFGVLADVVIDPVKWRVTHLVVQPAHHGHDRAHLVPIEALTKGAGPVVLSWSAAQIEKAPLVQVTDFIPVQRSHKLPEEWEVSGSDSLAWPYYPSGGIGGMGYGLGYGYGYGLGGYGDGDAEPYTVATSYDRVPGGTVEIRRASEVMSSDDHLVGHVDGFVVDPEGGITHLVLEHGHLWAHREITIPLADVVTATSAHVRLSVPRDAIGDYPSMPFHRHDAAA